MRTAIRFIKNMVLPQSAKPRTVKFGLAKGAKALIDFQFDTAFFFGRYERELEPHFRRLVRPGMKCFDVGGHRGWDAIALARLSGASVVSFECNAECATFMEKTIACSGLDIRVVKAYIGDGENGQSTTLDHMVDKHFVPDFVKIDIEGAEGSALRGARQLLGEAGPAMIIEVHGREVEEECLGILRSYGYDPQIVERHTGIFGEARGLQYNQWIAW